MKTFLLFAGLLISALSIAQKRCVTPALADVVSIPFNESSRLSGNVIKIPVVVHVLYHSPSENIPDAQIFDQIRVLNEAFRRTNADTSLTPARFKPIAADVEIEFELAISDPRRRNTNGIVRKYTPIALWQADDRMKFSGEMGSDAWDPSSYLNIWVCNMDRVAGYSSAPGGELSKDGIVLNFTVFGIGGSAGFNLGKTAVHETGHWLNLKHLWGDTDCGDDGVADTPKQSTYNIDCPSGIVTSCNNGPHGDMYMNYMDFTNDACMNMFTIGQKNRMRQLFEPGGLRSSILNSTGLSAPLIFETPLPDNPPRWLHPQLYPNPTRDKIMLDLEYDPRWIGCAISIINVNGIMVAQQKVNSLKQEITLSSFKPGMYFLVGKKQDGETLKMKVIKQ